MLDVIHACFLVNIRANIKSYVAAKKQLKQSRRSLANLMRMKSQESPIFIYADKNAEGIELIMLLRPLFRN